MSKKKKKKNKLKSYPEHVQQRIKEYTEKLSNYADYVYHYGIFSGKKKEDVERAVEIVKKNVKKLEKGKLEDVFTEDGLETFLGDID